MIKHPTKIVSSVPTLGQDRAKLQIVPFETFTQPSHESMLEKYIMEGSKIAIDND